MRRIEIQEVDGFPQAYMQLTGVTELPNPEGYTATGFLNPVDVDNFSASLANLYQVSRVS